MASRLDELLADSDSDDDLGSSGHTVGSAPLLFDDSGSSDEDDTKAIREHMAAAAAAAARKKITARAKVADLEAQAQSLADEKERQRAKEAQLPLRMFPEKYFLY